MRKLFKRIPKRVALALDAGLVLLLLLVLWVLLDYPSLTPGSAFRRGLHAAGLPELSMELHENDVGLAADEQNTYLVRIDTERGGWRYYDAWTIPAAEGLLWAPLDWQVSGATRYAEDERRPDFAEDFKYGPADSAAEQGFPNTVVSELPAFAVKTDAANASLCLVLELRPELDEVQLSEYWCGGRWELTPLREKNGWQVFGFDMADLTQKRHGGEFDEEVYFTEPTASLVRWMQSYKPGRFTVLAASLELTTRNAAGEVLETVSWPLP